MPSFRCIGCGRELNKQDVLYNITPFVLEGAKDDINNPNQEKYPIYVTSKELESLAEQAHTEDTIPLDMILSFLFERRNRDIWSNLGIRQVEAKDITAEVVRMLSAINNYKVGAQQDKQDSIFEDDDEAESKNIEIFGKSTDSIVPQLKSNFSISKNGQLFCPVSKFDLNDTYGYVFKIDQAGKNEVRPQNAVVCLHDNCHGYIPKEAFEFEQRLIGFIGEKSVGKTCLMTSVFHYLRTCKNMQPIFYSRNSKYLISKDFLLFNGCYELFKTSAMLGGGYNLALIDERNRIIYLLVDVAGEVFENGFDATNVHNNFPAVMNCDLYIVCGTNSEPGFDDLGEVEAGIGSFVDEYRNSHERVAPMLCAITKMDNIPQNLTIANTYNGDSMYAKFARFLMDNHSTSAARLMLNLQEKTFLSVLACSAYGMKPDKPNPDADITQLREEIELRRENDKKPKPKNIDAICNWIAMMFGDEPCLNVGDEHVAFNQERKRRLYMLDLNTNYTINDVTCWCIDSAFVNPSEYYKARLGVCGGGIRIGRIRRDPPRCVRGFRCVDLPSGFTE